MDFTKPKLKSNARSVLAKRNACSCQTQQVFLPKAKSILDKRRQMMLKKRQISTFIFGRFGIFLYFCRELEKTTL